MFSSPEPLPTRKQIASYPRRTWAQTAHAMAIFAILWAISIVSSACGRQTGSPQPVPIPDSQLFRSTAALSGQATNLRLIGLPNATAGAGTVLITNGPVKVQVQSTPQGTFAAEILAHARDLIEVRLDTSEPATYRVPEQVIKEPPPITVTPPPHAIADVPPVQSDPKHPGQVRVRGQGTGAGAGVWVINTNSGAVVPAALDAQAHFDVSLPGVRGQQLEIYNIDDTLDLAWILTIP